MCAGFCVRGQKGTDITEDQFIRDQFITRAINRMDKFEFTALLAKSLQREGQEHCSGLSAC